MARLKVINVTRETWEETIAALRGKARSKAFDKDVRKVPYDRRNGITKIPVRHDDWAQKVGYEHDYGVRWFSVACTKKDGVLTPQTIGHTQFVSLAVSILWNSAMYAFFTGKWPSDDAAYVTAMEHLKRSNCPEDLARDACSAVQEYCDTFLGMVVSSDGTINRSGLGVLEQLHGKICRNGGKCVNRRLRRKIADRLYESGIAYAESREEQEAMIAAAVRDDPRLKKCASNGIRRLLVVDGRYVTEGRCPIIVSPQNGMNYVNEGRVNAALDRFSSLVTAIGNGYVPTDSEMRSMRRTYARFPELKPVYAECTARINGRKSTDTLDTLDTSWTHPQNPNNKKRFGGPSTGTKSVQKQTPQQPTPSTFPQVNGGDFGVWKCPKAERDRERAERVGAAMMRGEDIADADRKFIGRWLKRNPEAEELFRQNRERMRTERKLVIKGRGKERRAKCKVL